MKHIYIILMVLTIALVSTVTQARSHKDRIPENGKSGWIIKQLDGDKLVWYSFRGEKFGAQQFVNVLSFDLNCKEYELDFVAINESDSLSSVAQNHNAIVGINAAYEFDASFIKTDGKVYSNITLPPDHIRYWKHKGAITYDGKRIVIGFGNREAYLKNKSANIFSSAPMLIDNYKLVGRDFVGNISKVNLNSLAYEDPRRHQGVRHPRTAVALTKNNKLLLITVDGRSVHNAGMSACELTDFLYEYFNPRYALNMDGGGSTSMYIKGSGESLTDIINYPTDNHRHDHYGQRQTYTFILIKRKK